MLKLLDYDFKLPEELIAQNPAEERSDSRLFVIDRKTKTFEHKKFHDIIDYLSPNDCLVINISKVIPARVFGKKESGGKVEILLVEELTKKPFPVWRVLLKPAISIGKIIVLPRNIICIVAEKTESGEYVVEFNASSEKLREMINDEGVMPLPPYIKRKGPDDKRFEIDKKRYQTVYAKTEGSIAAPTAGLHFTKTLLKKIADKGVNIAELTLHVGPGTFKSVKTERIDEHKMLPEKLSLNLCDAEKINETKKRGGKVFAVGTTTVRVLETISTDEGRVKPSEGETELFIYPGYKFKVVDSLITNFHLPKSTPLFLAAAFCGRELLFKAYVEAIEQNYRFFSYGDAMLII